MQIFYYNNDQRYLYHSIQLFTIPPKFIHIEMVFCLSTTKSQLIEVMLIDKNKLFHLVRFYDLRHGHELLYQICAIFSRSDCRFWEIFWFQLLVNYIICPNWIIAMLFATHMSQHSMMLADLEIYSIRTLSKKKTVF